MTESEGQGAIEKTVQDDLYYTSPHEDGWGRIIENIAFTLARSLDQALARIDKLEAELAEHRDTIERCASEHRANDMHDSGYY